MRLTRDAGTGRFARPRPLTGQGRRRRAERPPDFLNPLESEDGGRRGGNRLRAGQESPIRADADELRQPEVPDDGRRADPFT